MLLEKKTRRKTKYSTVCQRRYDHTVRAGVWPKFFKAPGISLVKEHYKELLEVKYWTEGVHREPCGKSQVSWLYVDHHLLFAR